MAVSPIVQEPPLKGPADKLMVALGYEASALGGTTMAPCSTLVLDTLDEPLAEPVRRLDIEVRVLNTIMSSPGERYALAKAVVEML